MHSGLGGGHERSSREGLKVMSRGIELVDAGRSFAVDARFDTFTEALMFDGGAQLKVEGTEGLRDLYPYESGPCRFRARQVAGHPLQPQGL